MELGKLGLELVVVASFKLFDNCAHEGLAELSVGSGPGAWDRLNRGPLLWLLFIWGSWFSSIEPEVRDETKDEKD
jgi:hypothetical protein